MIKILDKILPNLLKSIKVLKCSEQLLGQNLSKRWNLRVREALTFVALKTFANYCKIVLADSGWDKQEEQMSRPNTYPKLKIK